MRRVLVILCLALVGAGCAVPLDETAVVIDQDRLPEPLQRTTTTTTTTTLGLEVVHDVDRYVIRRLPEGARLVVEPIAGQYRDGSPYSEIIEPMFAEDFVNPVDEVFNWLPAFELVGVNVEDLTATVTLRLREALDPESTVIRDAAVQLVWTLTQFEEVDRLALIIDDERQFLRTESGDVDRPVTRADYPGFDAEVLPETITTIPTTTTTTRLPATSSGAAE